MIFVRIIKKAMRQINLIFEFFAIHSDFLSQSIILTYCSKGVHTHGKMGEY